MKKAASAVAALLFLFTVAGCGSGGDGLSDEEQKIADNIAKQLTEPEDKESGQQSGEQSGTLAKKDAECFADEFVSSAGVEKLEKANLINDKGEVQQSGATFDKALSEKYADAYLGCVDFANEVASTFAASDPAIDGKKLAECLQEELPDSLVKQVIIDTRAEETANSEKVAEANKKVADCQQSARTGGDGTQEKNQGDKDPDKDPDKDTEKQ